ncbi:hypothetical protein B0T10DRAFT_502680 [Thelonectria olida]|uniref:NAD(P)-binding domain-containing protein n=1 Tax=Thelonectria olida TaxID=1576542 RepID=A0A9P8VM68_9HYPO|nr:hypothetical protein B0T10DRAFT_502680 [Thelonectria olida]
MFVIKKVAILGASGTLGQVIVPALLRAGFEVTSIARPGARPHLYTGVVAKTALYDDLPALTTALQGQHAVVEAFNPAAAVHQGTIVQAALAAGVTHLITPDFSSDTFNPHAHELLIFEPKRQAQQELEELVASSERALAWTAIIVGGLYDWGIETGRFWVDRKARTITRFGSGDQKYSMSRLALTGDAVVTVLANPAQYCNKPAYFASHTVSTNQLAAIIQESCGGGWKVIDRPLDGFVGEGRELWEQDTVEGVKDRLNTQAYQMLGSAALFDEFNRYGADFGDKAEPGWDEGQEALRDNLKRLLN